MIREFDTFAYSPAGISDVVRRQCRVFRVDLPVLIVQRHGNFGIQQVHVGFPQRIDGTNVFPVAVECPCVHLFFCCQHIGDDVFAKVIGGAGNCGILFEVFAQFLPAEDIDTHRSQIALGIFGFLFKLIHFAVGFAVHDTETGSFVHGDLQNSNGAVRLFLFVECEHFLVIHFVDMDR